MAPGEFLPWSVMLTLKVAGVLVGIRDVRWVFLWSGCIAGPRPFLLVLVLRCSGRVRFFGGTTYVPARGLVEG